MSAVVWTGYLKHRARSRGFDLEAIEYVVRNSQEKYFDTITRRIIAVGRHGDRLVAVPYDESNGNIIPVTIHATTRQQVNARLRTGRFVHP